MAIAWPNIVGPSIYIGHETNDILHCSLIPFYKAYMASMAIYFSISIHLKFAYSKIDGGASSIVGPLLVKGPPFLS